MKGKRAKSSLEVKPSKGAAARQNDEPGAAGEDGSFPVVGVGASAGGLEAFTNLLKNLPRETGMAFVLVQHLDPEHESALPQILSRVTSLPVTEIRSGQAVEPNHVHVIPRDANLTIARGVLKLEKRPRTRAPHRPIDLFFESLAEDQRERAIGVVLSGTASDGTLGLEAIKAEGGITFAQDDSAKHDSMPRSAIAAGVVDLVLSPADIASELDRIARHPYGTGRALDVGGIEEWNRAEAIAHEDDRTALPSGGRPKGTRAPAGRRSRGRKGAKKEERASDNGSRKIMLLLRSHSGVDFSLYRSSTIERRIARRMVVTKHESLEDYAGFLEGNARELDSLYSDVLISVTSFFRNPESFDSLQRGVLPELLRQRTDEPVRCWVLGCSTGQEAYSIAIAFVEAAEKAPRMRQLQVFATDLNDKLLDKARHGLYAKSLADDVSPERLRRFFVEEEGGYRVTKMLREMVVFARQNLINDPPFSRMDLISCRNLLIYLEPALQKRALPTFHYALKPGGFLMLGASESVGPFTGLFEAVDRKHKIYSKKPAPTPALHLPVRKEYSLGTERPVPGTGGAPPLPIARPTPALPEPLRGELGAQREADRISISRFAPPGVLINDHLQVLQFRGPTGAYLVPPAGKASFDVLKMAREGLMLPLRAAIREAKKNGKTVRRQAVRVKRNGTTRSVNLEVIPLKNATDRCYLILFGEADRIGRASPPQPEPRAQGSALSEAEERTRVGELEAELGETREYLLSMQEQHEAANEELQAANEEVQSANEELQSINEELETSKEELESANEELRTVNEEMSNRNTELARLNNDLVNLQTSIKTAIVLLDRDLRIRRFSPLAEKLFDLLMTDIGRPIRSIRHDLAPADLETIASEVIATVHEQEREVKHRDARWYSLRVRPYLTTDNQVDGAVLVLVDIDDLKRAEEVVAAARDYAQNTVESVREPLLVLDDDLHVESANRAFYRTFRVSPEETVGRFLYELGNRQWDIPRLRQLLGDVLPGKTTIEDYPVEHDFETIGPRIMLLNARKVYDLERRTQRILLAIEDITERKRAEEAIAQSEQRQRALVSVLTDVPWTADPTGAFISHQPAWASYTGQSWEELRGFGWAEALHPEDRASIKQIWQRACESATFYESRGRLWHAPTEEYRHFIARATPLLNDDGSVREWVGTCTDVHEQTMADSDRARLAAIVTSSADAIISKNLDGVITTWNRGAERLFGYTAAEAVGKPVTMVIPDDRLDEELEILERIKLGELVDDFDTVRRRKDGSLLDISLTISPIRDASGRIIGVSKIARDITERSRLERKTREQAEMLADLHRRKDEFLAMLSHELRNPLAPLSNAVQLLRLQRNQETLQQQASTVIERQVGNLTRLVDDLLEVSRITTGRIHLHREWIALNGVVERAVETVRTLIGQRRHALKVSLPPQPIWLNGDAARLEQVVVNLLTNAAKYTEDAGFIWLSVQQEGDEAVLRVRDSGVGIDPELLPRIFDLFTQAERTLDRSQGGLGIGLSLVQRLVEMHGGRVEAYSALGHGSEFVVRLPVMLSAAASPSPFTEQAEPTGSSLGVLIVDDSVDTAQMLALLLKAGGHDVRTAHDGTAAIEAALDYRPNVVLLDIGLPGLDGYEVAKRLRQQSDLGDVVLVAMTGYGQERDRQRSQEAGFDHHLVKPVDFGSVQSILATVKPK